MSMMKKNSIAIPTNIEISSSREKTINKGNTMD